MNVRLEGREFTVAKLPDCQAISSAFLKSWCDATVTGEKPQSASKLANTDQALLQAQLTLGLLAGDNSVCSDPAIITWVSLGSHVADGKGACETSFKFLSSQGFFTVTDPSTGESVLVDLK